MEEEFAGICGYTQQQMEQTLAPHIQQLAEKLGKSVEDTIAQIKHWYNGYSWDGKAFVYNPFSVLLLLQQKRFVAHWFHTGSPSFLLKVMKEKNDISALVENDIVQACGFEDRQSLERLNIIPLLFQTGYLTVKAIDNDGYYHLGLPNSEVKTALTSSVLAEIVNQEEGSIEALGGRMAKLLEKGDTAKAMDLLKTLFAGISYNTHVPQERHYHALFQLAMNMAGINQQAEVYNSGSRADSVLFLNEIIYVVEIKYTTDAGSLTDSAVEAFQQIKLRNYAQPYLHQGKQVRLLGLAFTKGGLEYVEETISEA